MPEDPWRGKFISGASLRDLSDDNARHILLRGGQTAMAVLRLAAGASLSLDSSITERFLYVVSGRLAVADGANTETLREGDTLAAPPDLTCRADSAALVLVAEPSEPRGRPPILFAAVEWREITPGFARRILLSSTESTLVLFRIDQGAVLPTHTHVHEQMGFVIDGNIHLSAGTHRRTLLPFDNYLLPSMVPHSAEAATLAHAIDFFCPAREDYLPPGATSPAGGAQHSPADWVIVRRSDG